MSADMAARARLHMHSLLSQIDEDTLLRQVILKAGETACEIREITNWLNHLEFRTEEEKDNVLASLQGRRTRDGCFEYCNEARLKLQMVDDFLTFRKKVAPDWCTLPAYQTFASQLQMTSTQLWDSYQAFARASLNVEGRLPQEFFWDRKRQASHGSICSICQTQVEGSDEVVGLDCGHCFHSDCAAQWLRDHASCPNCRAEVVRMYW